MQVQVLIVDDNFQLLQATRRLLLNHIPDINIDISDNISEAIEKLQIPSTLKKASVNILIVDLKIPGLEGEEYGGLELIEKSQYLDPLRQIIVISAFGTANLVKKIFKKGVYDFIEKSSVQIELIPAVKRATEYQENILIRSRNPFIPMSSIPPTFFGGRKTELLFFEQRLNRASQQNIKEHFLVLGNWGIGKSSLLKEFKRMSQIRGHLATIVSIEPFQSGTKVIEAVRAVIEGILRDLPYPISKFKKVIEYFASFGINILGIGVQTSRNSTKDDISAQIFLHDVLVRLYQDLEDKNTVLVILLDDIDSFSNIPEFLLTLKQTLSMESLIKTKILFGLSSTHSFWLEITSIQKHHPLARFFLQRIELKPLKEEELVETIINSLAGTGVSFSEDILSLIYKQTDGHPFEMQVLCFNLFDNQLSRVVDTTIWEKSLQKALRDLGMSIFKYWYTLANYEETLILNILARFDEAASMNLIMQQALSIPFSSEEVTVLLQSLIMKNLIINPKSYLYWISDKMFCAYIRYQQDVS